MGLAERRVIATAQEDFKGFEAEMKQLCGPDLKVTMDWSKIEPLHHCLMICEQKLYRSNLCNNLGDALKEICETDMGKSAVREKLKAIEMIPENGDVTYTDGILTFHSGVDPGMSEVWQTSDLVKKISTLLGGLREKRAILAAQEEYKKFEADMKKICCYDIKLTFDWDAIANHENCMSLLENKVQEQYIFNPLKDAFTRLCADDMGKSAVRETIKEIVMLPIPTSSMQLTVVNGVVTLPSDVRGPFGFGVMYGADISKQIETYL